MTDVSRIHPEKIAAYAATRYGVSWNGQDFDLWIGRPSDELRALFARTGTASAMFITAFNPAGSRCPDAENVAANRRLREDLAQLGLPFAEGEGQGQGEAGTEPWPAEKSFLVLGIGRDRAMDLGRRYGQDAIVWSDADAVPALLILR
jgi:hypothetical protein